MPLPPGGAGSVPFPPYGQQQPVYPNAYPPQGPYPNPPQGSPYPPPDEQNNYGNQQPPMDPSSDQRGMGKGLFSGKGILGQAMKQAEKFGAGNIVGQAAGALGIGGGGSHGGGGHGYGPGNNVNAYGGGGPGYGPGNYGGMLDCMCCR